MIFIANIPNSILLRMKRLIWIYFQVFSKSNEIAKVNSRKELWINSAPLFLCFQSLQLTIKSSRKGDRNMLCLIIKILTLIYQSLPSKHSSWWRHLEDVFRLRLQKTSWSRPIYSSWSYVFKTSSRRFEDVFKQSSRRLGKKSSRHLQDVFKMP